MNDHPFLHAGYNYDDNNGDEVDGAGTNWPIWPLLFDTFEGKIVIIVTGEMMALFDTSCADFIAPAENNVITWQFEDREAFVRNGWAELVIDSQSSVIVFPRGKRDVRIRAQDSQSVVSPAPGTVVVPPQSRTATVRRKKA